VIPSQAEALRQDQIEIAIAQQDKDQPAGEQPSLDQVAQCEEPEQVKDRRDRQRDEQRPVEGGELDEIDVALRE